MPPKAKAKRTVSSNLALELEFGLRVTCRNEETGEVEAVVCRFCECWDRGGSELRSDGRKQTANNKFFQNDFRSEQISKHMKEQHPKEFDEYSKLRDRSDSTPADLEHFFQQTTVDTSFEKRSTFVGRKRIVTIDKNIVEVIIKGIFRGSEDRPGDRGMAVFEPQYCVADNRGKVLSCYNVTILDTTQFDHVTSLLAAGLSFPQVSRIMSENRDELDCAANTESLSEGEVSCFARLVCAVSLQTIADLMHKSWAFAVASDVSTDEFGVSHLDVRIRFPGVDVGDDLLSFHLLAIPLLSESPTAESLFQLFVKIFDAMCKDWKVKLIGSTTDRSPTMKGFQVGFSTRLANAVSGGFYRVWCLAHQLDLIIQEALQAIDDHAGFPFLNIMATTVGWLRRQNELVYRMGHKCPHYSADHWTSLMKVLVWLLSNRSRVCTYFIEKGYAHAAPIEWWLVAMVAERFRRTVHVGFEALQIESGVPWKRYQNLHMLLQKLAEQSRAMRDEACPIDTGLSFTTTSVSMGQFTVPAAGILKMIQESEGDATAIVAELDLLQKKRAFFASAVLYLHAMNGIARLFQGRKSSDFAAVSMPPCLPLELVATSDVEFKSLVSQHKEQLRTAFGDEFIRNLGEQHKDLARCVIYEAALKDGLAARTHLDFSTSWAPCGSRFQALEIFAAGLATVTPTSRVDGNVTLMGVCRSAYRAGMANFALEGTMYSKQYCKLQKVARQL